MKVRKVLVFPAGTEIGLEIHEALRLCKEVELHGAGVSASSHAPFAFEHFHPLPSVHEEGWSAALADLCRRLAIDYIFPAHDDVVVALAQERDRIPAVVLTTSVESCLTTRSKRATYAALEGVIRVPRLFDGPPAPADYPVFVKPDRGQGSQGVRRVESEGDLASARHGLADPLICEYLPGEEYTVDCFSDREQGLLFAGARVRRRMRNGIAVNAVPVRLEEAEVIARRIHSALGMRGAWFFQLKRGADDRLALLEVAPRIAGSMSAHRVMGVNFPLLTIFEHERLPIRMLLNPEPVELDRALRNRFRHQIAYSTLYIDLDDTLLLRGGVNLDAVSLVYQSINRGVKVKLLTRHAGDLAATLQRFKLGHLFDEIIHIGAQDRKSDFIAESDAIFVDDSFSERWDVSRRLGLRTFDCSMIELLLQSPACASARPG